MNIWVTGMALGLKDEQGRQAVASWGASLARGALHEFYAGAQADGASLSALVLLLALAEREGASLWVRHGEHDREAGAPHPAGLAELGVDPARLLFLRAPDPASALQAGLEGARCASLGAVVIELWGTVKAYDLTASRRLALAAGTSGTRVLLARMAATPHPSAAETRWRVRAVPSRALAANAPGNPAFEMTLLRARNGQEGLRYPVEWDRDARKFVSRPPSGATDAAVRRAPLPGAVVPVSFDRPGAPSAGPRRQAG